MPLRREIATCDRCYRLKRRCDRAKPACARCRQTGFECSYSNAVTPGSDTGGTSSGPSGQYMTLDQSPASTRHQKDGASVKRNNQYQADPAPPAERRSRAVHKRNRACLACTRCHRLKVKCDKKLPCTRCKSTGFMDHCLYTHRTGLDRVSSSSSDPSSNFLSEDPHRAVASWHSKHRGASHWKELLQRVSELAKGTSGDGLLDD